MRARITAALGWGWLFACAPPPAPPPTPAAAPAAPTAAPLPPPPPEIEPPPEAQRWQVVVQQEHAGGILALGLADGGRLVVTGSADQTIKLRTLDGRLARTIRTGAEVWELAVAPDGLRFAAAGGDEELVEWGLAGERRRAWRMPRGAVGALAYAPRDDLLAAANAWGDVRLFAGERTMELRGTSGALGALAFSPDGALLAAGDKTGRVVLWRVTDGGVARTITTGVGEISALAFAPDGARLAVASLFSTRLELWPVGGGKAEKLTGVRSKSLQFSADGATLYVGAAYEPTIQVWDLSRGKARALRVPAGPRRFPSSIALLPDRAGLLAASMDLPSLRLLDLDGRERRSLAVEGPAWVNALAFSPDGRELLAGAWDRSARLWAREAKVLRRFAGHRDPVEAVAWSPDGERLATGGDEIRVWDRAGRLLARMPGHRHGTGALCFTTDGQRLLSGGGDGQLKVWRVDGTLERAEPAHNDRTYAVAVAPNGRWWASCGEGVPLLWTSDGRRARELTGPTGSPFCAALAFSPDSRQVATLQGGVINLWPTDGGAPVTLHTANLQANVGALAFLPGGRELVATENSDLVIYALDDGSTRRLTGHGDTIYALAASPDGRHLASGGRDAMTRLWRLADGAHATLLAAGEQWITFGDDGLFDASPSGGALVAMVSSTEVVGIDQFAPALNRPDLLLARLELVSEARREQLAAAHRRRLRRMGLGDGEVTRRLGSAPRATLVALQQDGPRLTVRLGCVAGAAPVERYALWVNDVPLFERAGRPYPGGEVTETVELGAGENKVELSCRDRAGVESPRAQALARGPARGAGDLYVLGFGVSRYRDPTLRLAYADKDVRDLTAALAALQGRGFRRVLSRTYLDEACTVAAVREAKAFFATAGVDDTVILFAAGHGLHSRDAEATYYFLTWEADPTRPAETAADFALLEELLHGIAPRRKLLLLDTCESGELEEGALDGALTAGRARGLRGRAVQRQQGQGGQAPATRRAREWDRYLYNDLVRRSGAIVFSSSAGGELSYESDAKQNGLFTAALLEALSAGAADADRDRRLSIDELRAFVSATVARWSGELQHPTIDRDNIHLRLALPRR